MQNICALIIGKLFMAQKILIYLQWALKLMLYHEKNVWLVVFLQLQKEEI